MYLEEIIASTEILDEIRYYLIQLPRSSHGTLTEATSRNLMHL